MSGPVGVAGVSVVAAGVLLAIGGTLLFGWSAGGGGGSWPGSCVLGCRVLSRS